MTEIKKKTVKQRSMKGQHLMRRNSNNVCTNNLCFFTRRRKVTEGIILSEQKVASLDCLGLYASKQAKVG